MGKADRSQNWLGTLKNLMEIVMKYFIQSLPSAAGGMGGGTGSGQSLGGLQGAKSPEA